MDEQELFDLRGRGTSFFESPIKLSAFLDDLFIEKVKFPLVVGYEKFDTGGWRVHTLSPKTDDDEITVRNYMQGLRRVAECWNKTESGLLTPNFSGILVYPGIDHNDRRYQDQRVFGVSVGLTNSARNRQVVSYSLHLNNHGPNYTATTDVEKIDLVKIMERHLGPN